MRSADFSDSADFADYLFLGNSVDDLLLLFLPLSSGVLSREKWTKIGVFRFFSRLPRECVARLGKSAYLYFEAE